MSEVSAEIKVAAVNSYVEAFEKSDLKIIKSIYTEDAIVEDPVGSEPMRGIDRICEFYKGAFDMGIKIKLTDQIRCAGNACAFSFVVMGSGMEISPIDVFEFNADGKVVSMKAYWGPENMKS